MAEVAPRTGEQSTLRRSVQIHVVVVGKNELHRSQRISWSGLLPNVELLQLELAQDLRIYFVGRNDFAFVVHGFVLVFVGIRLIFGDGRKMLLLPNDYRNIPIRTKDYVSHHV